MRDLREEFCSSYIGNHLRVWRERPVGTISWDELQAIKNLIAGEEAVFIEVYPAVGNVINDAEIRHLWRVDEHPEEAMFHIGRNYKQ